MGEGQGSGPVPSSANVSAQMRRMPRAGTKPEMRLRRLLHGRGLRYKVDVAGLPGRPDVVFTRARLAVFVDGCFWHACPEHGKVPTSNNLWWSEKLALNTARDRRVDAALRAAGWVVLRVWEHEDPSSAADRVEVLVRAGNGHVIH